MTGELKNTLTQGLAALGLTPPGDTVEKLGLYCDLLLEQNKVMNLTAITDPAEVVRLHFLDSAALLPAKVLQGKRIIDVGTGAGFPGVVLKIIDPTIDVTLLDSLGKRVEWLQTQPRRNLPTLQRHTKSTTQNHIRSIIIAHDRYRENCRENHQGGCRE